MVDKPNTTPILALKSLLYLNVLFTHKPVDCFAWCIYTIVRLGSGNGDTNGRQARHDSRIGQAKISKL